MNESRRPLVSVITATYDMGRYVAQTVDSILAQTYREVECVVVDDGSTDDTQAVLSRYADDPRVRVFRQENAGQTAAKNRGLREARGELIGFCDADDLWHPDKLEVQLPSFANAGTGVVYSDFRFIDETGGLLPTHRPRTYSGRITGRLLADNFIHFPTALVRREALDRAGGFDETLTMAIDYDLWLRISLDWDFTYLPRILVDYRIWSGQMSHRTAERLDNAFLMMRRFLAEHPGSVTGAERRNAWAHTFVSRGMWHAREGRLPAAFADYGRAAGYRPWDRRLWRAVARNAAGTSLTPRQPPHMAFFPICAMMPIRPPVNNKEFWRNTEVHLSHRIMLVTGIIALAAATSLHAAPIASLARNPATGVYNEDRIDFSWTYSSAADSVRVDFGDGAHETFHTPVTAVRHHYQDAGRYDITLTVWHTGSAAEVQSFPNFVVVAQRPLAGNNMMFVHHSTGRNLIHDSGVRSLLDQHNSRYGTGILLWDHDYDSGNSFTGIIKPDSTVFHDWSYGAEANDIQPDGWYTIFCTGSAFDDSLFSRHDVILCKNDHSTGDIASDAQLQAYQSQYLQIRNVLDQHPEKLFVLVSGPPRRPEDTTNAMADRARVFYDWLQSPEFLHGHTNIMFFDLFDELAAPNDSANPVRNMLREEYRRPNAPTDSHPNEFANQTIGPHFALFLIHLVDPGWIGDLTAAPPAAPTVLFRDLGNRPNPFNPLTDIRFTLTRAAGVTLDVFDLSGRRIRRILGAVELPAGPHAAQWDGTDDRGKASPSGVYLYRIESGGERAARRMLLVR